MGNVFSLKESGILPLRIAKKFRLRRALVPTGMIIVLLHPGFSLKEFQVSYRQKKCFNLSGGGWQNCFVTFLNTGTDFPPLRVAKLLALPPEHQQATHLQFKTLQRIWVSYTKGVI